MVNKEKVLWVCVGFAVATAGIAFGVPRTFSAGNAISAAEMNQNFAALQTEVDSLRTQVSAGSQFRGARVYLGTASSPATSGQRLVEFASEAFDTDGFHDSTSLTRFTIPTGLGGTYLVACRTSWGATSAEQNIGTSMQKNGIGDIAISRGLGGAANKIIDVETSKLVQLAGGDYIECKSYSEPMGGTLNAGENNTYFELVRMGN